MGRKASDFKADKPIYLDYNATTPHDPEVIAPMRPFLEEYFGNPSSSHWYGDQIRPAVEHARRQVASLINCQPEEVLFTSGGTESNNYACAAFRLLIVRKATTSSRPESSIRQ